MSTPSMPKNFVDAQQNVRIKRAFYSFLQAHELVASIEVDGKDTYLVLIQSADDGSDSVVCSHFGLDLLSEIVD